jgi:hypothetical protein
MRYGNAVGTLTSLALFALALAAAPAAKASERCSSATLSGSYSDQDTGTIVGVGPFAGVNVDTFDGRGGLTIKGVSSVNGSVSPGTSTGTYQVNSDCTGTYSVSDSYGDTFTAFFVISNGGNDLRIIVTNAGTVINCIAHKQFPDRRD